MVVTSTDVGVGGVGCATQSVGFDSGFDVTGVGIEAGYFDFDFVLTNRLRLI